MKRFFIQSILVAMLCSLGLLASATPFMPVTDGSKYYYIQFRNSGYVLTDGGDGQQLKEKIAIAGGDASQKWKVTGDATNGYVLTSQLGNSVYASNTNGGTLLQTSASNSITVAFEQSGAFGNAWVLKVSGGHFNQFSGASDGGNVGIWNNRNDAGSAIRFVENEGNLPLPVPTYRVGINFRMNCQDNFYYVNEAVTRGYWTANTSIPVAGTNVGSFPSKSGKIRLMDLFTAVEGETMSGFSKSMVKAAFTIKDASTGTVVKKQEIWDDAKSTDSTLGDVPTAGNTTITGRSNGWGNGDRGNLTTNNSAQALPVGTYDVYIRVFRAGSTNDIVPETKYFSYTITPEEAPIFVVEGTGMSFRINGVEQWYKTSGIGITKDNSATPIIASTDLNTAFTSNHIGDFETGSGMLRLYNTAIQFYTASCGGLSPYGNHPFAVLNAAGDTVVGKGDIVRREVWSDNVKKALPADPATDQTTIIKWSRNWGAGQIAYPNRGDLTKKDDNTRLPVGTYTLKLKELTVNGVQLYPDMTFTYDITATNPIVNFRGSKSTNGSGDIVTLEWSSSYSGNPNLVKYKLLKLTPSVSGPATAMVGAADGYNVIYEVPFSETGNFSFVDQGSKGGVYKLVVVDANDQEIYTSGQDLVLPVKIISFTGISKNNKAQLTWKVGVESEVVAYEVQRQVVNGSFETVGTVAPKGANTYTFEDALNAAGTYRLLVKGINGNEYSNVIVITANVTENSVKLYPNPVQNTLTVEGAKGLINIVSLDGQRVLATPAKGVVTQINVASLAKGIYILIVDGKGYKFAKQ